MTHPTVLILAAGENSRFFPLNQTTHKGALTLLGKPLILRTLENLELNGFEHAVIVVSQKDFGGNGLSGFVAAYEFKKLKVEFCLQSKATGMGDAVLAAKDHIRGNFAVAFPSNLDAGDILATLVEQAGKGGALAVSYTDKPWMYGIVSMEDNRITGIVEKPEPGTESGNLYAYGIYYLTHEYLAFLEALPDQEYAFEQALDNYFQAYDVTAVERPTPLPSLKYPWHLFDFQKMLFESLPSYVSPYAQVAKTAILDESHGHIYIENGARVGHAVKIVGPAYIGKDVFIGDFSLIRASSFEEGSSVGVHSDVTRSLVMEHASMHNGFMGDSVVGRNVKIGAGLITSNRRMDRSSIVIQIKDKHVDTGSSYMGTVIGDNAKIGVRVNIMPGKFIGCRAVVYPAITIWEHIPHDATVKQRMDIQIEQKEV